MKLIGRNWLLKQREKKQRREKKMGNIVRDRGEQNVFGSVAEFCDWAERGKGR